ncbi:helix-turn-helix transcriptional regulator [Silvimonas amylolytica]|uniref:Transcriptional regulator, AlpA family n=1 Tax=Silvimonas amylolytica TaxID=449663 RepID=A0ABQ2PGY1_9NEIS|nr:AlpA family phage regulatory protein [Silvimonas amylolytica]GGP24830.1 hypothetical protein GCM10010971_06490 [Silvimonas amylolytica]
MTSTVPDLADLPANGYVRQSYLVGPAGRKAVLAGTQQHIASGILPFSSATLWRLIKAQKFPAPVKLSARVTAWRVEDIRAWLMAQSK